MAEFEKSDGSDPRINLAQPGVRYNDTGAGGADYTERWNAGEKEVYDNGAAASEGAVPMATKYGPWPLEIDLTSNVTALSGIDATLTGTTEENVRTQVEQTHLDGSSAVYLEGARTAAGGGESVDIELYDATALAVVGSITLAGSSERTRSADLSGSLTAGNEVKLRANVTTAAASGTVDVTLGRLVLE